MSVTVVIGAQWGDEGKGKLVDFLSDHADVVARYQGGANAGHTVHVDDKKYILHLIPGGILHAEVTCAIGNGVVFDPEAFFEELEFIESENISVKDRLFVSERAHVIFPYHKMIDQLSEERKNSKKIGTTGRGIGPAYVDKYNRCGIRVIDLYNKKVLKEKLKENIESKNKTIVEEYHQPPVDLEKTMQLAQSYAEQLRPYCTDTQLLLYTSLKENKQILLEGAQGCLLDTDFGSYPYVTSSNPTAGGAVVGSGLPPTAIDRIIGVIKAYTTRVGSGPFPSEKLDKMGDKLRETGHEFGATTGRPRRCGWFDAVAARYSVRVNGFTELALTKLDVLEHFPEIEICTGYMYQNKTISEFPADLEILENCEMVTEKLPGWQTPISDCRKFDDLPQAAQNYVRRIEQICTTPVKYISVGVERNQIIVC
jgi:adenylosuccinate synthase